jgi:hypothetical protein
VAGPVVGGGVGGGRHQSGAFAIQPFPCRRGIGQRQYRG